MSAAKSTAQRAFSVLIAGLLISSVVAPAAFSGTAAAQTSGDGDHCTETAFTQLVGNVCEWTTEPDTVNDSDDRQAAYVQADLHAELRSEEESSEQLRTVFDNYGQDTGTIASLEARNAIATAYENNQSASTADAKAQTAVQDYYSVRQINTLEAFSKQMAQIWYVYNTSKNHPTAHNDFAYPQGTTSGSNVDDLRLNGLATRNYTLANGSTHQYKTLIVQVHHTNTGWSYNNSISLHHFENNSEQVFSTDQYTARKVNGLVNVRSSYAGTDLAISDGHPAQVIGDVNAWAAVMKEWSTQSDTVTSNYQAGTASDLYTAMDDGRLDPADVRGAEGQVRYLSGDSNATSQRYKAALYGTLDMQQAGFNSTFYVEYTGYTEANYNQTLDGNRTLEYSGYVENKSYEGMVFSSEIPSGGFQPGETYNTSKLNGTTMIYSQSSGTVTFVKGNLTISKITDQEGNEQESVSWEKPKYDTNDVSEYIDYLNKTQQMQLQLLEAYSDDSDTSGAGGGGGWQTPGSTEILAGLAVLAALAFLKES